MTSPRILQLVRWAQDNKHRAKGLPGYQRKDLLDEAAMYAEDIRDIRRLEQQRRETREGKN